MKYRALLLLTILLIPANVFVLNHATGNVAKASEKKSFGNILQPELLKPPSEVWPRLLSIEIPIDLRGIQFYSSGGEIKILGDFEYDISPGGLAVPVKLIVQELPYDSDVRQVIVKNVSYVRVSGSIPLVRVEAKALGYNISITSGNTELPTSWVSYRVYRGIDPVTLERKMFLVIKFYPLIKSDDGFLLAKSAIISVSYLASKPKVRAAQSQLDVLIVTNKTLLPAALLLAEMKNKTGLKTAIITVQQISVTFSGRDLPEKIRNAIKHYVDAYGIKFVIILGDADVVPVRYAYIPDGAYDDDPEIDGKLVETDLYYADLDYTWNDNNDSRWGDLDYDRVDGVPDVVVGRIPASTLEEALGYIKKLQNYKPEAIWWARALLIGTDTFMRATPEGEFLCENISHYIWSNFTIVKLYESEMQISAGRLLQEFSSGYGFVNYAGHGDNHLLYITLGQAFTSAHAELLKNSPMFPVVFTMACSSGRFGDIDGFGEKLVMNPNGGAIVYVGSSRIAWGYVGQWVTEGLAGEMNVRFVKSLFSELRFGIGRVWAEMIKGYVLKNDIYEKSYGYGYIEWKVAAEYNLLGDPTLFFAASKSANLTEVSGNYTSLTLANGSYILNGTLSVSNLVVENATLYLNGFTVIVNSSLIIRNSRILGLGNLTVMNSSAEIAGSTVPALIIAENSNITAINSTASISLDDSKLNATGSVLSLTVVDIPANGTSDGFISSHTSERINLTSSYASWKFVITSAKATLERLNISELVVKDSNIKLLASYIGVLRVSDSNVTVSNTTLGLEVTLSGGTHDISIVKRDALSLAGVNVDNSLIFAVSIIIEDGAEAYVRNSMLNKLVIVNGSATVVNSTVYVLDAFGFVSVESSDIFITHIYGYASLRKSNVTHLVSYGEAVIEHSSVYTVLTLGNGSLSISSSDVFHADEMDSSTISAFNVTVVELVQYDKSSATFRNSAVMLITAYGSSKPKNSPKLRLINSTNSYFYRAFGKAVVYLYDNATLCPQYIVMHKSDVVIEALPIDHHSNLVFQECGFVLVVIEGIIESWDLVVIDSTVSARNCYFYSVILYGNSSLTISDSVAIIIRATHMSHVEASNIITALVMASANATLTISDAEIVHQAVYFEHSSGKIESCAFGEVVLYGDVSVSIINSAGEDIVIAGGAEAYLENVYARLWLYFEDVVLNHVESFGPYVSYLATSEAYPGADISVTIKESRVLPALVFFDSKIGVVSGFFDTIAFINSTATVKNARVVSLFYSELSEVVLEDTVLANLTLAYGSEINGSDVLASLFYLQESNVTLKDSMLSPVIVVEDGYARAEKFAPLFGNLTKGTLIDWGPKGDLHVINSFIRDIAFVLLGDSTGEFSDSQLLGVLTMDDSKAVLTNTYVRTLYALGNIVAENVSAYYLALGIKDYKGELSFKPGTYDYLSFSYGFGSLNAKNFKFVKLVLEIYSSKVTLKDLEADTVTSFKSELETSNAKIETLTLTYYSKARITNSSIDKLGVFYYSSVNVSFINVTRICYDGSASGTFRDSSVGLTIRLRGLKGFTESLKFEPAGNFSGTIERVPFEFSRCNITGYYVVAYGLWSGSLSGKIKSLVATGLTSITVENAEVDSVSLSGFARVKVEASTIGLSISGIALSGKISIDYGYYITKVISFNVGWRLSLSSTTVKTFGINITVIASRDLQLDTSAFYLIIIGCEDVVLSGSTIPMVTVLGSQVNVRSSKLGYLITDTSDITISDSKVGLTKFYYKSANVTLVSESIADDVLVLNDSVTTLRLHNTKIVDWTILALYNATVVVTNSNVGGVESMDKGVIVLIDSKFQLIPYVHALGRIEIYWTLQVKVYVDFLPVSRATVEVIRNGSTVASARADEARFLLPQAVITKDKRTDLGEYTVKATYSVFSAEKHIYLYKPMTVKVWIITPAFIAFVAVLAASVYYFGRRFFEKRKKAEEPVTL